MFMMFLMLPTLCYASFFDNYTNLITYSYTGENCAVKPAFINVSDTVTCLPGENISICCEDLMKKNNFENPLNICYNKNGNSSFSSCYERRLTPAESDSLGTLAVFGVIFFLFMSMSCFYITVSCCVGNSNSSLIGRSKSYKSINQ